MKNILFINSDLCSGGAEQAMATLANQFAKSGSRVTMALLRNNNRIYKLDNAIEIIQFKNNAPTKLGKMVTRLKDIRKTVKRLKPNVTISYTTGNNLMTIFACIGINTKIIVSERLHPLLTVDGDPAPLYSVALMRALYPMAHRIVFQTEMARACFKSRSIQHKSVVIANAVKPLEIPIYYGDREKSVVAAGRFAKQKNFEMLITAFSIFHRNHSDYKLIIYGKGILEQNYRDLAINLGIKNDVEFPGHVSDLKERMRTSGIYVSSSDFEGISNSMLEALSLGVPTICTDCPVGGASLVIESGVNGILIPIGDVDALAAAMSKIASDLPYAKQLSKNAVEISNRFSPEKIQALWEECF